MKLRRLRLTHTADSSRFPHRTLYAAGEVECSKREGSAPEMPHSLEADMQARVVWIDDEDFVPFEMIELATKAKETEQKARKK